MIILRQKEFNSKLQKALRIKHDVEVGKKVLERDSNSGHMFIPFNKYSRDIYDSKNLRNVGRHNNKVPTWHYTYRNNINKSINEKVHIRDLEKEGFYKKYEPNVDVKSKIKRTIRENLPKTRKNQRYTIFDKILGLY